MRQTLAQVSQVYWVYLLVSLLSKGDCHVTVTVAESADRESGGTKVKVSSRKVFLHPDLCWPGLLDRPSNACNATIQHHLTCAMQGCGM